MKKNAYFLVPVATLAFVFAAVISVQAEGDGSKKDLKPLRKAVQNLEKKIEQSEFNINEQEFSLGNAPDTIAIGNKGHTRITGAKVTAIASTTLTISIWNLTFTVHQMPDTNVTARGGGRYSFGSIKVGDIIDVKGALDATQAGLIHAKLVHDRSALIQQNQDRINQLRAQIQEMIERLNRLLGRTTPPPSSSDTTAPSMPTNVSASVVSSSQINLSWSASTDNIAVTGYKVYRCMGSGCTTGDVVATVSGTSYQNTGLSASTTYVYTIAAYDVAGNYSTKTVGVSPTTQSASQSDTTAPSVPTGLSAGVASSTQVNLAWNASTDAVGVTGYKVYRCSGMGCTPSDQLATVMTTSYQNTGVSASTTYVYSVAAYDAAGNTSDKSLTSSVTMP